MLNGLFSAELLTAFNVLMSIGDLRGACNMCCFPVLWIIVMVHDVRIVFLGAHFEKYLFKK